MEKEQKERLHRQWVAFLPWMSQKDFVSFADYCDRCTGKNIDTRPAAQILAEISALEAEQERRNNGT